MHSKEDKRTTLFVLGISPLKSIDILEDFIIIGKLLNDNYRTILYQEHFNESAKGVKR